MDIFKNTLHSNLLLGIEPGIACTGDTGVVVSGLVVPAARWHVWEWVKHFIFSFRTSVSFLPMAVQFGVAGDHVGWWGWSGLSGFLCCLRSWGGGRGVWGGLWSSCGIAQFRKTLI